MRELSVQLHSGMAMVEIRGRPRLSAGEWNLHAKGRIVRIASPDHPLQQKRCFIAELSEGSLFCILQPPDNPIFNCLLGTERD